MDIVYTGNAHNKSLIYPRTEALSKPSTGWGNLQDQEMNGFNEAFVEFLSCWDLNATTVESETAIEITHNYQTNAKYNIRQITKTITNTNYQTGNKCQTDDPSPECHHKYTEKELKVQNTKEQMIIEGNPTIPEQFVNVFIEEKLENQNKISVQLSSCQYKNADENVNVHVRNSRVYSSVSHPQFRMRREREPSRISYKIVARLSNGKRKKSIKLYIQKYVPKSSKLKTMLCEYHHCHFLQRCRSSKFMFLSRKCFIRQSLSLCIFRARTPKHKNLPLFCMIAKGNIFRKLRQLQMKTYHFSSRIISLS